MLSSRADRAAIVAVSCVLLALAGAVLPGCGGTDAVEKAGSQALISAKDSETAPATEKGKKALEAESEIFKKSKKIR